MDEVGGRWTFSRANEGYTSCGPVVEMSKSTGLVPCCEGLSSVCDVTMATTDATIAHIMDEQEDIEIKYSKCWNPIRPPTTLLNSNGHRICIRPPFSAREYLMESSRSPLSNGSSLFSEFYLVWPESQEQGVASPIGSRDVMAQGWCPAARGSILPACPGVPAVDGLGRYSCLWLGWVGNYVTSSVRIPWWYVARGYT